MKHLLSILIITLLSFNVSAQNHKGDHKKSPMTATISNGQSKINFNGDSFKMVFPQFKDRFNTESAFILTTEGDKLKMGQETITQWSWNSSPIGNAREDTAYNSTVSNSVEISNGGRDVTITTTTTTTNPDGSSTTETKTTTVSGDTGSSDTTITVTHTQATSSGEGVIVVIVD